MKLRSSALSHVGHIRPENEDSFLCNEALHLYGVADGIGGLPAGAQASQLTMATLEKMIRDYRPGEKFDYDLILTEVNQRVFNLGRILSPQFGIGSTLTFAHLIGIKLHVTHVGDSGALRLRSNVLEPLTRDHNVENEMKDRAARGEPMGLLMENRNALTRCIGQPPPIEGDLQAHTVLPHDRYLLATDGITRFVSHVEMTKIMREASEPADAAAQLIAQANDRGGLDNATAVVLFFD